MAGRRIKDSAEYGLIYMPYFEKYCDGVITDAQLKEIVCGYAQLVKDYRKGKADPASIPCPSVIVFFKEIWQKHLETFIEGIEKTEARRKADRERQARHKKAKEAVTIKEVSSVTIEETAVTTKPEPKKRGRKKKTNENKGICAPDARQVQ